VVAVSAFRKAGWVYEAPGLASTLEIEVREVTVTQIVTLAQLQRWLNGAARSPAEKFAYFVTTLMITLVGSAAFAQSQVRVYEDHTPIWRIDVAVVAATVPAGTVL
jgi:hypothetical protein